MQLTFFITNVLDSLSKELFVSLYFSNGLLWPFQLRVVPRPYNFSYLSLLL